MGTRVLIVEDHAVVREGTREILARDATLEVAGEAGTASEAVRLARELRPDVILLDLALPDRNGIDAVPDIAEAAPDARILVLSAYDDEDYVVAAIEAGAAGYLLKTMRGKEVIEAIHAAREGRVTLHPAVAAKLRHSLQKGSPSLSPREREILELAARGLRNKEIGRAMHLSVRTVEGHLSHILAKLGVSSRTEAVVYGVARHWFDMDRTAGETSP
ncbi:MAG: response regulator transcription factor [Actinomycetota bacterium]